MCVWLTPVHRGAHLTAGRALLDTVHSLEKEKGIKVPLKHKALLQISNVRYEKDTILFAETGKTPYSKGRSLRVHLCTLSTVRWFFKEFKKRKRLRSVLYSQRMVENEQTQKCWTYLIFVAYNTLLLITGKYSEKISLLGL